MLIQHHSLRSLVAAEQCTDQQTMVLVQLLHGEVRRAMELDEPLLTSAAEQGSGHVELLLNLDVDIT